MRNEAISMPKRLRILSSSIAANFSKLFVANVVAQTIGLLIYPILTRLYRPEDFGLFNVFISIGSILVILANCEYQNAILLPKTRHEAVAVVHSMIPTVGMVTLLSGLCVPMSGIIEDAFNAPGFAQISWLLPLFIMLTALWNILNFWLMRSQCYTSISTYQVVQSLTAAGSKVGLGSLTQAFGLCLSAVIALLIGLFSGIGVTQKRYLYPLFTRTTAIERKAVRAKYHKFPLFTMPSTLITDVRNNLPIWVLTPAFCLESVGFYGLAVTLAFQPIRLFSRSLYQVFFQHVTERMRQHQSFMPLIRKYTLLILGIALPTFTALWFVLPTLIVWLLGNGYQETGEYIQLMLPWALCSLVGGVLCFIPNIFRKQHVAMWIELVYTALELVALLIGVWTNSMRIAIFGYSIVATIVIIGQTVWYFQLVHRYELTLK